MQHVSEMPVCFPSSVYGTFVCTLYMTFKKFAPAARHACGIPDEPWMCGCCVKHVICSKCNSCLFSIPLHELGKVKHRWFHQHFCLHPAHCGPIPLDPISTQAFEHLPLSFCFHSLNPLLTS